MIELTLKEAVDISIKKWKLAVKHYKLSTYEFTKMLSEKRDFRNLLGNCGLCEYQDSNKRYTNKRYSICDGCLLNIKDNTCIDGGLFSLWYCESDVHIKKIYAKGILDILYHIKKYDI